MSSKEEAINRIKILIQDDCDCEECIKDKEAYKTILEYVKQLEAENKNLNMILETGLNKDKQYCFNEDGNTGKCLGYGDDEPCEYCKTCERLSIKETD